MIKESENFMKNYYKEFNKEVRNKLGLSDNLAEELKKFDETYALLKYLLESVTDTTLIDENSMNKARNELIALYE